MGNCVTSTSESATEERRANIIEKQLRLDQLMFDENAVKTLLLGENT